MDNETVATPEVPWGGLPGQLAPARRRVTWGEPEPVAAPSGDAAPAPAPRRRGGTPADTFDAPAAAAPASVTFPPATGTFPAPAPAVPAVGADLGSVFDGEPAAAEGLGGLFDDPPTATQPPAAPVVAAGADLGGLFDDPVPAVAAPAVPPAADLGDLFDDGEEAPVTAAPTAPAADDTTAGDAPAFGVGGPVFATAAQTPDAPTTPDPDPDPTATATDGPRRAGLDLASRRAALAAASPDSATLADTGATYDQEQRFAQLEYYYHYVERILALGRGGDPELQSFVKSLELTRDKELDAEQRRRYEQFMLPRLATAHIQIPNASDVAAIFDLSYDELIGIGPLGPLWRDDDVTEIKLMSWDRVVVERNGQLQPTAVRFRSADHAETTARQLAQKVDDRALSPTNPLPTAQLPGARVQFVYRPLVKSRLSVTIRKFRPMLDMSTLLAYGSLSEEMAAFLCDAVRARATILVSGGTGSGKTTFVNALSEFIPDSELVITIEDALELQLRNTYVESLLTKEAASADDRVLFGQDELLKATLRMRPDRIIVGEIRDGRGAEVMLQAANTGHDGTMTTIHANTPELAMGRLANLLRRVEAMPVDVARTEVTSAINVVVQVVKKRGRRFVSAISVVHPESVTTGAALTETLFVGEFPRGARAPSFRQVASLRPDTELAIKMSDAGLNPACWELP